MDIFRVSVKALFVKPNFEKLAQEHLCELFPGGKLRLDYKQWLQLELKGRLVTFGAYDKEELVGYAVYVVFNHIIFGSKQAEQMALYLAPEYRQGVNGIKLIKTIEDSLFYQGCDVLIHGVNPNKDFSLVLKKMGYHKMEEAWAKYK